MSADVRLAGSSDLAWLEAHDRHIDQHVIRRKIDQEECLIIVDDEERVGWLRWSYFWDLIPFMNMLVILEEHRAKGYGRRLVNAWEERMRTAGFQMVMTSTQVDEEAQHFYRKLGYQDAGGFVLPGDAMELILIKPLNEA